MAKSKKYFYDYDMAEEGKGPKTMIPEILADSEFPSLTELVIGDWGTSWEEGCQQMIDDIVANKEKFSHITSLFIGDMDFEECEVSWIIQGDYSRIYEAMPQLKSLTIKGSTELRLGTISHERLEELTIICGGLSEDVFKSIEQAHLPNLKKLLLYIGVEDYGFDGSIDTIRSLLANSDFPRLSYLGLTDSELQNEVAAAVLESKYIGQIETLDLSEGTLNDKGGEVLLAGLPGYPNVKKLDLHYHYMTEEMEGKLKALPLELDVSERNLPDEYNGELWMYPMLTE